MKTTLTAAAALMILAGPALAQATYTGSANSTGSAVSSNATIVGTVKHKKGKTAMSNGAATTGSVAGLPASNSMTGTSGAAPNNVSESTSTAAGMANPKP